MSRPIYDTLPEEEQILMEQRNPNPQNMPDHRMNWNWVYGWGWTSHKFYTANKLHTILAERDFDEDQIRDIFKSLFNDVPPYNPQAEVATTTQTANDKDSIPSS